MDFQVDLNLLECFLACILLESFIKFLVNPYYEPLLWFMIIPNLNEEPWLIPEQGNRVQPLSDIQLDPTHIVCIKRRVTQV